MEKTKLIYNPIIIEGRTISKSWWGQAWCHNLESYADYSNRINRGKSYVRAGNVIHLDIANGTVIAKVQGSRVRPYNVKVTILPMSEKNWVKIKSVCNNKIESLSELVKGNFPSEFSELFTQKSCGLFPSPNEIKFECSCPDWAFMCKHVAAVLYGIGVRLDDDPTLFFKLRNIEVGELIKKSIDDRVESMLASTGKKTSRTLNETDIIKLFGDDIDI